MGSHHRRALLQQFLGCGALARPRSGHRFLTALRGELGRAEAVCVVPLED